MLEKIHNVIIIGSGPAGYTAAIYAARAELKPLVLAGPTPGGQLMWTTNVENFPGFPNGIQGPDLMEAMKKQAQRFGAVIVAEDAKEVNFSDLPFKIKTGNNVYTTKTVIIATGAEAKWLGLESEERLKGKGVSACATCDGAFFKDKEVVVVGGGDAALEEALFMTKFASKITIIHRRDELRASKIMQKRVKAHQKISFEWNQEVVEILGENMVRGVKTKNIKTNEEKEIPCQGVFVAIGHKPNTDIFQGVLEMEKGYLKTKDGITTTIPGVFVAGDVFDYRYRQAITAAGSGCKAAIEAEKFLEKGTLKV